MSSGIVPTSTFEDRAAPGPADPGPHARGSVLPEPGGAHVEIQNWRALTPDLRVSRMLKEVLANASVRRNDGRI